MTRSNRMYALLGKVRELLSDERGLETVEYAIIVGLIVAGTVTTVAAIGTWVAGKFTGLKTSIGA